MNWRRLVILSICTFVVSFASGCAGCGEVAGAGETCDAELDEPCENDERELVCVEDDDGTDRCLHPAGAVCEEYVDNCIPDAECATDEEPPRCLVTQGGECDPDDDHCAEGLICEEMADGDDHQCHPRIAVRGQVFDAETEEAIEGAHVIAFDEEQSALSDVAVTDEDGHYELTLPAERADDGEPVRQFFTLRASAHNYQTFPGGIRQAQPIDASAVEEDDDTWVIDTAQTDIALLELPADDRGYASITGAVDIDGGLGSVLVVAEPEGVDFEEHGEPAGFSAVSGLDGSFTIFNVPPGDYELRGYLADYQIEPEAVSVDDADVDGVVLTAADEGPTDLSGQVQIVRTEGETSVVLMVASTFDEVMVRGEVPSGLRAPRTGEPNVSGGWTIEGVPAGQYVVLAGFENDDLVRSPDEGMAGTELVYIDVEAGTEEMTVDQSFKVTEALETVHPGSDAPEGLSDPPTLTWGRISHGKSYDLVVYNAYGDIVMEETGLDQPSGQNDLEVDYDGDFEPGMYYQFRGSAFDDHGHHLSSTEFLRGVFFRDE